MLKKAFTLTALLFALMVSASFGQTLTETNIYQIARPSFYESGYTGTADTSGTYYFPSMIQHGTTAFMFTQGGQFTGPTTPGLNGNSPTGAGITQGNPGSWCSGDKIILWTNPLTDAGLTSHFTQKSIVSVCPPSGSPLHRWGPSGAILASSSGPVYLVANLTIPSDPTSLEGFYLYTGTFNTAGNDFSSWTNAKLFDVSATVGSIGCCTMAIDTTRTAPSGHQYFRGFGGYNDSIYQVRMDVSSSYCADPSVTSPDACVDVDIVSGGVWRHVNSELLDFVPDTMLPSFRPYNLVRRGTNLELWGSAIVAPPSPQAPCTGASSAGQFQWYTVNSTDFSLTGPGKVFSLVRPMPAVPAANRIGADLIVLGGKTYLFSSQNDDNQPAGTACAANIFTGMDIVTTILQ
ncbi:MAG TPA: hypothetical protein VIE43_18520 [Thermoanaerobaculia bacterium]|jgi:hypothetical protein|nr:hypothetical protein [Thermoanaerobaculia bacterium]